MEAKNIIGLGLIGAAAFLAIKSEKKIEAKTNPTRREQRPEKFNHKVPQKDLWSVLATLSYLENHPNMYENAPAKSMKHIIREKWFDEEKCELTDLGREFLAWAHNHENED